MMMNGRFLFHCLVFLTAVGQDCATAFIVPRPTTRPLATTAVSSSPTTQNNDDESMTFNPPLPDGPIDMDRATYCAEHFGACPVEEVEHLRDNLHRERLQHFVFHTTDDSTGGMDKMSQQQMEHFVVEEELELQLNLLQDMTPDPSLFPDGMQELPHLKDGSGSLRDNQNGNDNNRHNDSNHRDDDDDVDVSHRLEDAVHRAEHAVALQETVLEESNLETLAICAAVLAMVVVPQVMNAVANS